jgi:hypothetical protein
MLEEEPQHFPRGVRSPRISVGARRAASRPPFFCVLVVLPALAPRLSAPRISASPLAADVVGPTVLFDQNLSGFPENALRRWNPGVKLFDGLRMVGGAFDPFRLLVAS